MPPCCAAGFDRRYRYAGGGQAVSRARRQPGPRLPHHASAARISAIMAASRVMSVLTNPQQTAEKNDLCALFRLSPWEEISSVARHLRRLGKGNVITYSPKVFLPLTNLCRDRCGYCTFRRDPGAAGAR